MFTRIFKDLKHTFKTMGRNPGPFVVAGLTLALGIGACAAIYSVVETVLLRPLPFPEPGRLVAVKADLRGSNMRDIGFSQPEFEDLRLRAGVFEEISVAWPMDGNLTGVDKPHRIEALGVSAGYFNLLGVKPAMGRLFLPEDGEPWMSQSAVLSYHAWQRLFGADPKVLGRKIRLDYDPYVVVGVLPAGFQHPGPTLQGEVDIWLTGCYKGGAFPTNPGRTQWRMFPGAIGRLKPGLDTRQAQALLDVFGGSIRRQYPAEYPAAAEWTPGIEGLQQSLAGESRRILLFLLVAVALVLLICCVTVANLVLARTTSRSGEFAVRTALGAGRGDLVRQILIENLVLGVAAGFVALGVAAGLAPLLLRAEPLKLPQVNAAGIERRRSGFCPACRRCVRNSLSGDAGFPRVPIRSDGWPEVRRARYRAVREPVTSLPDRRPDRTLAHAARRRRSAGSKPSRGAERGSRVSFRWRGSGVRVAPSARDGNREGVYEAGKEDRICARGPSQASGDAGRRGGGAGQRGQHSVSGLEFRAVRDRGTRGASGRVAVRTDDVDHARLSARSSAARSCRAAGSTKQTMGDTGWR